MLLLCAATLCIAATAAIWRGGVGTRRASAAGNRLRRAARRRDVRFQSGWVKRRARGAGAPCALAATGVARRHAGAGSSRPTRRCALFRGRLLRIEHLCLHAGKESLWLCARLGALERLLAVTKPTMFRQIWQERNPVLQRAPAGDEPLLHDRVDALGGPVQHRPGRQIASRRGPP